MNTRIWERSSQEAKSRSLRSTPRLHLHLCRRVNLQGLHGEVAPSLRVHGEDMLLGAGVTSAGLVLHGHDGRVNRLVVQLIHISRVVRPVLRADVAGADGLVARLVRLARLRAELV